MAETPNTFTPELGQMLFGHSAHQFDGGNLLDAAMAYIREELDRVLGNLYQASCPSPFDNSGCRFETEGLAIHAYDWGDDSQPWNLKCGEIEVSWYKYFRRGQSMNKPLTPAEIGHLLDKAIAIVRSCEGDLYGERDGQPFSYDGRPEEERRP